MLISKKFILCVAMTFFTISVHAGHKRIVIRVPQRTRHIYHHHVKKVPVYVLLPGKKPKILDDLEELTDQHKSAPCKETGTYHRHDEASSQPKTTKNGGRDSYSTDWTEDKDNPGSYLLNDGYRTINHERPIPPASEDDFLPFRRANVQIDNNRDYHDYRSYNENQNYHDNQNYNDKENYNDLQNYNNLQNYNDNHNYNYVAKDQSQSYSYRRNVAKKSTSDTYRKKSKQTDVISFTYAPIAGSVHSDDQVSSYQYRISHRIDNRTLSKR